MKRLALVALAVALLTFEARAQQSPNDERGMTPGKSYLLGDLDTINTFNGNLNIALPLGPTFHVGGNVSYALAVRYGGNPWEMATHDKMVSIGGGWLAPRTFLYAYPARGNNAGMGWRLSLGELFPNGKGYPYETSEAVYVAPDGGEHVFTGALHPSEAYQDSGYTTDGSYLRLSQPTTSTWQIEFPNGTVSTFNAAGQLLQIADRMFNYVTIAYEVQDGNDPAPGSTKWHIYDSTARHQWVYFRPSAAYFEGGGEFALQYPVATPHTMIDRVDVAAFGGTRAVYQFNYDGVPGAETLISRRCDTDRDVSPTVSVSLLSSITLPASAGQYAMTYDKGDGTTCSGLWYGSNSTYTGNLLTLQTPIGSTTTYAYSARWYQSPTGPNVQDIPAHNYSASVASRKITASAPRTGTPETLSYTTYNGDTGPLPIPQTYVPFNVVQVEQRTSTGEIASATRHYFSRCALSACTYVGEYGLPFARAYPAPDSSGAFLSTEELEASGGTLTVRRSTYVKYEFDRPSTLWTPGSTANARVAYSQTQYEDGKYSEVTSSDFDGLGHYRKTVTGGNFDSGNVQTAITTYNPARGTFELDSAGTQKPGYTRLTRSEPWVLNTFTSTTVSEPGQPTLTSLTCFDANGFLTSRRTLKGATISSNDLLAVYTPLYGNVAQERYWGGDNPSDTASPDSYKPVPAGFACGQSPSGEAFRIDHTYAHGSLETSTYVDGSGASMPFRNVQNVVDATGLVSKSIERAVVGSSGGANDGLATQFDYDALGRLADVTPLVPDGITSPVDRGAKTHYTYAMNPPKLTAETSSGSTSLSQTITEFDGVGRTRFDSVRMPGGAMSTRETRYDLLGRRVSVSELDAGPLTHLTQFEYDWAGRPTKVIKPDGTFDTAAYSGVSSVSRTAAVRTGGTATTFVMTDATTIEEYDGRGRLVRVHEPNGVSTAYGYDAAGHLITVCANEVSGGCGQQRLFTYDGRGLLTAEQHPEKGAVGNGSTTYRYDSRGHAIRRIDGTAAKFDLTFRFDRAERLYNVSETATDRPLKAFSFGTSNDPADYRNGQLVRSIRYNWMLPAPGQTNAYAIQTLEEHAYGGRDGRPSARRTYVAACVVQPGTDCLATAAGQIINDFSQSFAYDALGTTQTLDYPACTSGCGTTTIPARHVTMTRDNGMLTSVAWDGLSATLAYSASGMLTTVQHPNTITDHLTYADEMPTRLKSISASATNAASCVAPTFSLHPASRTVLAGNTTPFTLTAAASGENGSPVMYQWYTNTGSGWSLFGGSTSTGTIYIAVPSQTTSYKVNASNACGNIDSDVATVTICTAPAVTSISASRIITLGQTITLTVSGSGSGPLTFQWYTRVSGTLQMITGATGSGLGVSPSAATRYVAVVSNACGSATSSDVLITVASPPAAPTIVVSRNSSGGISMTWSASSTASGSGIARYEVLRVNDNTVLSVGLPSPLAYTDATGFVVAGAGYAYRVRAVDGNNVAGPYSLVDIAVTIAFQDDPVVGSASGVLGTPVRGVHVGQLRQAVDAVRVAAQLPTIWPSYDAATGLIYLDDVVTLQTALNEARYRLGMLPAPFTGATAFGTPVRAADINELRAGVK
jgi:YD repeat-containing protein